MAVNHSRDAALGAAFASAGRPVNSASGVLAGTSVVMHHPKNPLRDSLAATTRSNVSLLDVLLILSSSFIAFSSRVMCAAFRWGRRQAPNVGKLPGGL